MRIHIKRVSEANISPWYSLCIKMSFESRLYKLSQLRFMSYLSHVFRDVYEGTRMATEEDLPGIRKLIYPLEESGVLVRRTDKEVC